jgi:hypothetical protein
MARLLGAARRLRHLADAEEINADLMIVSASWRLPS